MLAAEGSGPGGAGVAFRGATAADAPPATADGSPAPSQAPFGSQPLFNQPPLTGLITPYLEHVATRDLFRQRPSCEVEEVCRVERTRPGAPMGRCCSCCTTRPVWGLLYMALDKHVCQPSVCGFAAGHVVCAR